MSTFPDQWGEQWITGSVLTIIFGALGLWKKWSKGGSSVPLFRKLLRWGSATARVPLVEDALEFTTEFNTRLLSQRDRITLELDIALKELSEVRIENTRLRTQIQELSTGSKDTSII